MIHGENLIAAKLNPDLTPFHIQIQVHLVVLDFFQLSKIQETIPGP